MSKWRKKTLYEQKIYSQLNDISILGSVYQKRFSLYTAQRYTPIDVWYGIKRAHEMTTCLIILYPASRTTLNYAYEKVL